MRWRTRKLVALSILWWEVSWVFILDFIKAYINIFKIGETNSPFVFILKIRTSTNQRSTKKTCTSVISTSCVTCISKQRTSQVPEIFNGISFRVCTWELNKCNKRMQDLTFSLCLCADFNSTGVQRTKKSLLYQSEILTFHIAVLWLHRTMMQAAEGRMLLLCSHNLQLCGLLLLAC